LNSASCSWSSMMWRAKWPSCTCSSIRAGRAAALLYLKHQMLAEGRSNQVWLPCMHLCLEGQIRLDSRTCAAHVCTCTHSLNTPRCTSRGFHFSLFSLIWGCLHVALEVHRQGRLMLVRRHMALEVVACH